MHHVHTDGDTVLREKDHAHPVSPRDTDLAHFISSVKFNASSDSPADVVRMAQLGATDDVRTVIPSKENLKQLNRRLRTRDHRTSSLCSLLLQSSYLLSLRLTDIY